MTPAESAQSFRQAEAERRTTANELGKKARWAIPNGLLLTALTAGLAIVPTDQMFPQIVDELNQYTSLHIPHSPEFSFVDPLFGFEINQYYIGVPLGLATLITGFFAYTYLFNAKKSYLAAQKHENEEADRNAKSAEYWESQK